MSVPIHQLWTEKYRPQSLDTYVYHSDQHYDEFTRMVETKTIPHLLLSGVQGTGKTTLARILINAVCDDPDMDALVINASNERGIDTFRDKVMSFANTWGSGPFKIIHLEEADKLTNDAQTALKAFMEEVSDRVRFILTCNTPSKIIPPIQSRCVSYQFQRPDRDEVVLYVTDILRQEGVKFTTQNLLPYVDKFYPDIRRLVSAIQAVCGTGLLPPLATSTDTTEGLEAVCRALEEGDWNKARSVVNQHGITDWVVAYRWMYDNVHTMKTLTNNKQQEAAIVVIADHLYKHAFVADPEINFASMLIQLSMIGE